MRILILVVIALLVAGCGPSEPPADPRQNPIARDYQYYVDNPAEADRQLAICDEIPSQARPLVLEGNCSYARSAAAMRGFGDQ